MARTRRVKSMAEGTAHYHLVSRACNRQFLFRKARAKEKLAELLGKAAEFSGIAIEAFAVMDNHIHVLCTVVRDGGKVPEAEVVRRVRALKGDRAADELAERCAGLAAAGFGATLEAELDRYRARMNDISGFMKTAKELFAIWFNREFGYSGSVWSGVYKSTMVEGGEYLARCRRYIVLNPVRAGIVGQAKDYRWVWCRGASGNGVFAGCLPRETEALGRRVAQISDGKIYGSEGFVRRWILGLGDRFNASRVTAHAVGELGFSSHGWRLAKAAGEAA
jgi:REP element-mobilizing transposase RayT